MDYKKTRGWRNCNPLNIKDNDTDWQGLREEQTDKVFCQFTDLAFGYRAAIMTLQSYYRRFKKEGRLFTLDNIIHRWAPDGNEANYIKLVEQKSGIDRYQVLPEPKTENGMWYFTRIMAAMTVMETGCPIEEVPMKKIEGGYWLAYRLGLHGNGVMPSY